MLCSAACDISARPFTSMDLPCASPKADRETAQHRSDLDRVDSVAKTADTTSRPAPPFTNPILGWVPGVGHFRRARVGHFWRAPRRVIFPIGVAGIGLMAFGYWWR